MEAAVAEERRADVVEQGDPPAVEDRLVMYKTKLVQFLGRSTPIILQNDNGPCPLLAICNVLSLRNAITLNPDVPEVSQDQLLAMVADRLLESNSDVKSKDDGYVNNQQQNISDAIDLLPRLATGIDVNVHFRKINDFEFTRECAIFDLLDIGLYHGWIVDPETDLEGVRFYECVDIHVSPKDEGLVKDDKDTTKAIGSKSYNTLVGELVALETQHTEARSIPPEEDTVDFAAATAATLGIPSPSLSRGLSFDDPLPIAASEKVVRKGDLEEEAEVMKALTLSRGELSTESILSDRSLSHESTCSNPSSDHEEGTTEKPDSTTSSKVLVGEMISISEVIPSPDLLLSQDGNPSLCSKSETESCGVPLEDATYSLKYGGENHLCPLASQLSENVRACTILDGNPLTAMQSMPVSAVVNDSNVLDADGTHTSLPEVASSDTRALAESIFGKSIYQNNGSSVVSGNLVSNIGTNFSGGIDLGDAHQSVCTSLEGGEPIYEGEECIIDSGHLPYQNQEPVYEGEMVLAEQVDKMEADTASRNQVDEDSSGKTYTCLTTISVEDGQLIRYFLKNNASQLTIYGLFRLQEGLNERELCVFFRNNHFSTMFKFEGELYLLVTDQGYLNQPDLVWEKLNEVNGDTVFMTGNFKEFKMENQSDSWSQQNAMTNTADYLAVLKGSASEGSTLSSDLQLAIALQEQEFDRQPVCPEPQNSHPSVSRSRLITGPQVPPRSVPATKPESKSKDKCVVM